MQTTNSVRTRKKLSKHWRDLALNKCANGGSHVVLKKGVKGCVVPLDRELATGTLRGILRQAGVSSDEFRKNL